MKEGGSGGCAKLRGSGSTGELTSKSLWKESKLVSGTESAKWEQ